MRRDLLYSGVGCLYGSAPIALFLNDAPLRAMLWAIAGFALIAWHYRLGQGAGDRRGRDGW